MEGFYSSREISQAEQAAYIKAMTTPVNEMTASLVELVPLSTLAKVVGAGETRMLHEWAEGTRQPRGWRKPQLRTVFQLIEMVKFEDKPWVAGAWLDTYSPRLDTTPSAILISLHESENQAADILNLVNAALDLTR